MTALRCAPCVALAVACLGAGAGRAGAQEPPPIPTELPSLEGRPSPTGAMVRSFVLPGWGQSSYDRYLRGGVYFAGHAGNAFMIFKTLTRLDEARDIAGRRADAAEARFIAEGHPADSIAALVDAEPTVVSARGLVSARESQREDWLALGLFWVLISGVDAFVTAQLADFPASIGATTDGRSVGIVVTVPVR